MGKFVAGGQNPSFNRASKATRAKNDADKRRIKCNLAKVLADPYHKAVIRSSERVKAMHIASSAMKTLVTRIRSRPGDFRVLKLSEHFNKDAITKADMLYLIAALHHLPGEFCDALYFQNMKCNSFDDSVLQALLEMLKCKSYWAANLGECFGVTQNGWNRLVYELHLTNICCMYISESSITSKQKSSIIDTMRKNRKTSNKWKHQTSAAVSKVTHMWWNPTPLDVKHHGRKRGKSKLGRLRHPPVTT
jgi:hypothetical protein